MRQRCVMAVPLFAVLAACGPGSPSVKSSPPASAVVPTATAIGAPQGASTTAQIGAAGGALSLAGGAVTLTVPLGSTSATSAFTAMPISSHAPGAIGTAFRIESSEPLKGPVKVTFKGPASYPAGVSVASLGIRYQDARGFWLVPDAITRDAAANTVTATTSHLSDWALVLDGPPALEGTFTLAQSVGIPFSATGTAALYAWSVTGDPTYYVTGTVALAPEITWGTEVCVPDAPTQSLELGVAEVHAATFRWGLNARWVFTCTDSVTGAVSSQDAATLFDTMRITLTSCAGDYVGTQVNGDTSIQGSYTSNCGVSGAVSATWDFRACSAGGVCQPGDPCRTGTVTCNLGVGICTSSGNAPEGTPCGEGLACDANGACI